MTAMEVTNAARKHVLLLHYVGEEMSDILETLTDTRDDKEFEKACEALIQCFS